MDLIDNLVLLESQVLKNFTVGFKATDPGTFTNDIIREQQHFPSFKRKSRYSDTIMFTDYLKLKSILVESKMVFTM